MPYWQWMRQELTSWMTLGGLLAVVVMVTITGQQVAAIGGDLAAIGSRQKVHKMQRLETDVSLPGGGVTKVITERGEGEALDAFVQRHNEAVNAVREAG